MIAWELCVWLAPRLVMCRSLISSASMWLELAAVR